MLTITTTYKVTGKGEGRIVATAQGKQATVKYDHARSIAANHGAAAGALANRLIPEAEKVQRGIRASHTDLGDGKRRFVL